MRLNINLRDKGEMTKKTMGSDGQVLKMLGLPERGRAERGKKSKRGVLEGE